MLNVLVTGAGGQLGSELRRSGKASANNYIYTDAAELDITDAAAVERFVAAHRIDVIENCAAYTDVERAEEDEQTAYAVNCTAAGILAAAAARHDALLIHISTDYVFDGRSGVPYTEDMTAAPLNAYGRTKLAGERAIAESGCRHIILRTSWLYSGFGHNFLRRMLSLTAGRRELRVVADQIGTPTYAADLADAIFDMVESRRFEGRGGIYHFANEGRCSWYDFACAIAAGAGRTECRISPCRTDEYPSRAVRPAYSVLDKSKYRLAFGRPVRHWRDALRECIDELTKGNQL